MMFRDVMPFFRGVVFGGTVAECIAKSVNSYYACLLGSDLCWFLISDCCE